MFDVFERCVGKCSHESNISQKVLALYFYDIKPSTLCHPHAVKNIIYLNLVNYIAENENIQAILVYLHLKIIFKDFSIVLHQID